MLVILERACTSELLDDGEQNGDGLWRFAEYLQHRIHFSLKRSHLVVYSHIQVKLTPLHLHVHTIWIDWLGKVLRTGCECYTIVGVSSWWVGVHLCGEPSRLILWPGVWGRVRLFAILFISTSRYRHVSPDKWTIMSELRWMSLIRDTRPTYNPIYQIRTHSKTGHSCLNIAIAVCYVKNHKTVCQPSCLVKKHQN